MLQLFQFVNKTIYMCIRSKRAQVIAIRNFSFFLFYFIDTIYRGARAPEKYGNSLKFFWRQESVDYTPSNSYNANRFVYILNTYLVSIFEKIGEICNSTKSPI